MGLFIVPSAVVSAGILDWFGPRVDANELTDRGNVRTMALLESSHSLSSEDAYGGGDIAIVDGNALASDINPLAVGGPFMSGSADQISIYVVREGDTLSQIADMFDVTPNTIRWANDISARESIQPDDRLVILPITGVKHIVKKGDTPQSVAKQYKADLDEVLQFNALESGAVLIVGEEIIIPNGEIVPPPSTKSSSGGKASAGAPASGGSGYFTRPVNGGVRTQGIHGYNAVDIATSHGATVYAAAAGEVIVSRSSGYNGGYGQYVVIKHNNGTQTLYSHLSANNVSVGQSVAKGAVIGAVGTTGRSTGAHLHFEVRGGTNPF